MSITNAPKIWHVHGFGTGEGSHNSQVPLPKEQDKAQYGEQVKQIVLEGIGVREKNPIYMDKTGQINQPKSPALKTGLDKIVGAVSAKIASEENKDDVDSLIAKATGLGEQQNIEYFMHQLALAEKAGTLPERIVLSGYSRGAGLSIELANRIYEQYPHIKIAMHLTDPVMGPFRRWPESKRTLPKNVDSVVTVYARDHNGIGFEPQDFSRLVGYDPMYTTITTVAIPMDHFWADPSQKAGTEERGYPHHYLKTVYENFWSGILTPEQKFYSILIEKPVLEELNKNTALVKKMPLFIKDKEGIVWVYGNDQASNKNTLTKLPPSDALKKVPFETKENQFHISQKILADIGKALSFPRGEEKWIKDFNNVASFSDLPHYKNQSAKSMSPKGITRLNNIVVKVTGGGGNLPPNMHEFHGDFREKAFDKIPEVEQVDIAWEIKKKKLSENTPEERKAYNKALFQHGQERQAGKTLENDKQYQLWIKNVTDQKIDLNQEKKTVIGNIQKLSEKTTEDKHQGILADVGKNVASLPEIIGKPEINNTSYQRFYLEMREIKRDINTLHKTLKQEAFVKPLVNIINTFFDKVSLEFDSVLSALNLNKKTNTEKSSVEHIPSNKTVELRKLRETQLETDKKMLFSSKKENPTKIQKTESVEKEPKKKDQEHGLYSPPLSDNRKLNVKSWKEQRQENKSRDNPEDTKKSHP